MRQLKQIPNFTASECGIIENYGLKNVLRLLSTEVRPLEKTMQRVSVHIR